MRQEEKLKVIRERAEIFLKRMKTGSIPDEGFRKDLKDFFQEILSHEDKLELEDDEHLIRLSAAFEQSANSIFITDTQGNIEYANPRFYKVTGYTEEEVLGRNPRILKYEKSLVNYKDLWETISSGKTWTGEILNRSKSGALFWEIGTITPVKNKQGKIINYLAIKEDITHRKIAEKNLLVSEQKYRSLFDKSYDAILILDGLKIIDCNRNAGVLFKDTCEHLQSSSLLDLSPDHQLNGEGSAKFFQAKIREVLAGQPLIFDTVLLCSARPFEAEVSMARIYFGHKTMVQAIVRDVSEKRQTEKQIIQAKEEAEKARKAQLEFLSLMSHEIRTPLNAVVALTDLMLHEKLTPDQLENLDSVKISARHLLGLIDDILDFNKIESGNIEFECYNFDIRSLVHELKKTLEIKAREKNINLLVHIGDNVPKVLQADTLRLNQVLFNLFSNGIKFTEKGFVSLTVKLLSQKVADCNILFEVEDSGIGISSDRLDAIFEKFTQAETSTTRKYGGSGLGLTVCKRLVELQGGKISALSKPGVGSVFTFSLPMKIGISLASGINLNTENSTLEALDGMRILMVEDDKMNQFVGRRIIEKKWHANLTIAATGEQALSFLEEKDFDLILMDLLLPSIDGYELTKMIRSNITGKFKNPNIPIIALTADAFLETRKRAFEAGVDDFLTKPFDFEKLFQKMIRYFPDQD
jgi:PAS domain S-box-containing protein